MQARGIGPFRIIKRVGPNPYLLDLPPSYAANPTFNIKDLTIYHPPIAITKTLMKDPPVPPTYPHEPLTMPCPLAPLDKIDFNLDEQIISTLDGGIHSFSFDGKDTQPHIIHGLHARSFSAMTQTY